MAEAYPNGKSLLRPCPPPLIPGQIPQSSDSPNATRIIPRMRSRRAIWVLRLRGRAVARQPRVVQPIRLDAQTPKRRS